MNEARFIPVQFLPVTPLPASMVSDLNPSSKTEFSLGDLDCVLLANRVLATGPVVLGDLYMTELAVMDDHI